MKEIKLYGKRAEGRVAMVDDEDFEYLNQFRWFFGQKYIMRMNCTDKTIPRTVLMHREVMKFPKGKIIDHKDRNPFNNTRENLRVCSRSENNVNRSKMKGTINNFKGVSLSSNGSFKVEIKHKGKQYYLGSFYSELYASYAFDIASVVINTDFSLLNHQEDYLKQLDFWFELVESNRTGHKKGHNFKEKVMKIAHARRDQGNQ